MPDPATAPARRKRPDRRFVCLTCGRSVRMERTGAPAKLCSPLCRSLHYNPPRQCRTCGVWFLPSRVFKDYCSEDCRRPRKLCGWCGREFRPRASDARLGRANCCSRRCRTAQRRCGLPIETTRRVCETCGTEFSIFPRDVRSGKTRRHCSSACRKRRVTLRCQTCGRRFSRKRTEASRSRFCSVRCYRRSTGETSIEKAIRLCLRDSGIPFEAEAKIARWSVDFLVASRWVVEADGAYWHAKPSVRARDTRRDTQMARLGYRVVRLSEPDIRRDPECVIRALLASGLPKSKISPPRQIALPI